MRAVLGLIALVVVALAGAMLWQHVRYLHARREFCQDHQPLLHAKSVFHVVTFLELAPGADLFESVRKLRDRLETGGEAQLVYAGQVALNALTSSQLVAAFGAEVPWDAVVVVQWPSRQAFERAAGSEEFGRAFEGFARSYSNGMQREALLNLLIPQLLLAKRIEQIVTRAPSHYPFVPATGAEVTRRDVAAFERLSAARELGKQAAVIVNLVKDGTSLQAEADRGYVDQMFGLMAEGGHGPLHLGESVTLEKGTDFDRVALVYYPGVPYFIDMAGSRFYQGIVGGKQLGDTQVSITVPILDRLD